ncbi:MAG: phosphohistidine phosphatase SixA [Candidatus Binatia bacterium]
MRLYILRHGIAEDAGPRGDDGARRLTPEGRAKMRRAAVGLKRLGVEPELILTSPLPRAAETAAIVAELLAPRVAPREVPALATGSAAAEVLRALRPFAQRRRLMLVGHEPTLSELASLLLTGSTDGLALRLKKGGCLAIALEHLVPRSGAALAWVLTPRQLRRLGA